MRPQQPRHGGLEGAGRGSSPPLVDTARQLGAGDGGSAQSPAPRCRGTSRGWPGPVTCPPLRPVPVACAATAVSRPGPAQACGQVGRPRTGPRGPAPHGRHAVGQVTPWGQPRGPGVRQACPRVTAAPRPGCTVSNTSRPLRAPGSHPRSMPLSGQSDHTSTVGAAGQGRPGSSGASCRGNRRLQALGLRPAAHAPASLHQAVHAQSGAPQDPRRRESGLRREWLVAVGSRPGPGWPPGPCQRGRSCDLWAGRSQQDSVQHGPGGRWSLGSGHRRPPGPGPRPF